MKKLKAFEKALIVSNYHETLKDLGNKKIVFSPVEPTQSNLPNFSNYDPKAKINILEKTNSISLDPSNGLDFINSYIPNILGYDESYLSIKSLKGTVYFTCHCIVRLLPNDFDPICLCTANYFTRAKDTAKKSKVFHYVDADKNQTIDSLFRAKLFEEKKGLLSDHMTNNSILIIDGPLIGSMLGRKTMNLAKELLEKNIITVFVTKNSDSSLLINRLSTGNYNSDLDWASDNLIAGTRSSYMRYFDKNGHQEEIFCYLKSFNNVSPLRVSFISDLLEDRDLINQIMEMLYYLVLDQGTPKDPQIRLISVAEMFAKDILKVSNPYGKVLQLGLVPTINQSRWGIG
ncbi:DNA double-strand break repair nuclease NurA [Candidatus Woesearchaeota archaeon]|nr:DNA double-strand break repair nuclease NurA [Candidatus Woesearchaeota archaeon]